MGTDVESLVKALVEHCAARGRAESSFLYPNPQHYVYTFELFDRLSEASGVSKEQIGEWFESAQIEREAKRER